MTRFRGWMTRHPFLALMLFGSIFGFIIDGLDGSWSDPEGGFTTSHSICVGMWEANEETAGPRDSYIANCERTNADMSDGTLDGR